MKKLALLAAISCSGASLFGYTNTFYNTTPGKVAIKLNLIAASDKNVTLEAGQDMQVGTGAALMRAVEVRGLSGPIAGMKVIHDVTGNKATGRQYFINYVGYETLGAGQTGGVNISIGGNQVTIKPGTGSLQIEQR